MLVKDLSFYDAGKRIVPCRVSPDQTSVDVLVVTSHYAGGRVCHPPGHPEKRVELGYDVPILIVEVEDAAAPSEASAGGQPPR